MTARRRFAQHFLEPAWVAKLVAAIAAEPGDRFVEIGPGRGALTVPLAARVARLAAVEVDRDLAAALEARHLPNVSVTLADVLTVDLAALAARELAATTADPVRVAGNLPYNISSPILVRLFGVAATGLFRDATLMLQKEVVDRLVATPGTGEYGVLTITAALAADVVRVLSLPPGAFRPPPRVHSAAVRLTFRPPPADVGRPDLVLRIVRDVFTQRRKMLSNALAPLATTLGLDPGAVLAQAAIDARRRPETLSLSEFARIADVVEAAARS